MKKILLGFDNTANNIVFIRNSLKLTGKVKVNALCFHGQQKFYTLDPEIKYLNFSKAKFFRRIYNPLKKLFISLKIILNYHAIVYIGKRTLYNNMYDVRLFKKFGLKISFLFYGCEIRDNVGYVRSQFKYSRYFLCEHCTYFDSVRCWDGKLYRKAAEHANKLADSIFAGPGYDQLIRKDYHPFFIPYKTKEIDLGKKDFRRVTVVHSPSSPEIKGTVYVRKAIENLKNQGIEFEYIELSNMPNEKVLQILSDEATICIDQLLNSAYGLYSVEAMSLHCAIVCSFWDELLYFAPDLPVIRVFPETLEMTLKDLITNPVKSKENADLCYNYVKKYHNPLIFGSTLYNSLFKDINVKKTI